MIAPAIVRNNLRSPAAVARLESVMHTAAMSTEMSFAKPIIAGPSVPISALIGNITASFPKPPSFVCSGESCTAPNSTTVMSKQVNPMPANAKTDLKLELPDSETRISCSVARTSPVTLSPMKISFTRLF